MAEKAVFIVEKNTCVARDVYAMRLLGPTKSLRAPGQFVNIRLPGFYLRRPLSVAGWNKTGLDIYYKILGAGTAQMAEYQPGMALDVLAGLGNGFDVAAAGPDAQREGPVVLAGGGVGAPPLYALAKALLARGVIPHVALGFFGAQDVFLAEDFRRLGCPVSVALEEAPPASAPGNAVRGLVTDLLAGMQCQYYYACGPMGMLRAVHALFAQKGIRGQLSFEERMGCGFGVCMGCSCQTLLGAKRVCVEGPVFSSREVSFS